MESYHETEGIQAVVINHCNSTKPLKGHGIFREIPLAINNVIWNAYGDRSIAVSKCLLEALNI